MPATAGTHDRALVSVRGELVEPRRGDGFPIGVGNEGRKRSLPARLARDGGHPRRCGAGIVGAVWQRFVSSVMSSSKAKTGRNFFGCEKQIRFVVIGATGFRPDGRVVFMDTGYGEDDGVGKGCVTGSGRASWANWQGGKAEVFCKREALDSLSVFTFVQNDPTPLLGSRLLGNDGRGGSRTALLTVILRNTPLSSLRTCSSGSRAPTCPGPIRSRTRSRRSPPRIPAATPTPPRRLPLSPGTSLRRAGPVRPHLSAKRRSAPRPSRPGRL